MSARHASRRRTAASRGGYGQVAPMPFAAALRLMNTTDRVTAGAAVGLTVAAGVVTGLGVNAVLRFVVAGLALAALAAVIGQAIEQVGGQVGPSATGLLQSTLGNLPELFFSIFALQ